MTLTSGRPTWGGSLQGVTSACEEIKDTKAGHSKKKKRTLIKGANLLNSSNVAPGDKAVSSEVKDKQSEDPTIIKKSLPIDVEQSHLNHLREYFSIPTSVEKRLPLGADQVYHPLVVRGIADGPLSLGCTSVYIEFFTYGVRFPFSSFTNDLLIALNRALARFAP
ncbi:hypothetical protein LIER_09331 [Lithospermum erythrorhizon]|uniref:Uncharacterized protein n=1 Tax=Lithospermum erythrorhizon TaxID=34254 RepID=A0AAV3PJM4_LITER